MEVTGGRGDVRLGGGRRLGMADILGTAGRVQDVADHERSVRRLRGCCLRRFGAGGTSNDGLGKLGRLCIGDALPTGRRRRRRRG